MCHMRRRRIHVSAHRAQSTLIIILEPHELSSSSHRAQSTLIKALSSHQRTEEEDTCARRLASKDSPLIKGLSSNDSHPRAPSSCVIGGGGYMCQTTLIKGLSSSYFNRIVGKMHKDTSVCVNHPFTCARPQTLGCS